ncbi:MAG TPA: hypothetical protein VFE60_20120, partial [Roseiarcus sp.]|nr:hypothetical protein [Roseiarcus sp.]
PLALFGETIDREPKHALFVPAQVSDADARKPIKAQLLGGFVADFAVDNLVVATHKERNAKAQGADRRSDLPNMSGIKFADFSRRRPKVSDRNVGKLQSREDVITPRACGRNLGQSLLMITATTALSAQVLSKNRPKRTRICAISHLHCRTKNKIN